MKTAIVYYSLDGNCAFVATQLAERLNADVIRIKLADDKKRKGIIKYLWGGSMVVFKRRPAIKPVNFDPAPYDSIILGSPVWANSLAAPMRSFLADASITGKKISLFVCYAGDAGVSLEKFKEMLPGNEIIAEAYFHNPVKRNDEKLQKKIDEYAKVISYRIVPPPTT